MTIDEIVAYLRHSKLPTLVVEGVGDRTVLHRFERELQAKRIDILPVGGKDRLGALFERRNHFAGALVAFLRDRDELCALPNVAPDTDRLIYTNGYSIENDILDRAVIADLAGERATELSARVAMIAEWFRFGLQHYKNGRGFDLARDVSLILDGLEYTEQARLDMQIELATPFVDLQPMDAWSWLRGKTLLRIIQDVLSRGNPAYSKDQILDLCLKFGRDGTFDLLKGRVLNQFPERG